MLTDSQKAALHADMIARPELASMLANGDDIGMAAFYNAENSTPFVVWRTSVTQDEIMTSPDFNWTRVDNLTTGKARIWELMFKNSSQSINPSAPNIRAGIDATWVGTAADLLVREAVYTICKRNASVIERLFATGTGTTADPAVLVFEGPVSFIDISGARVWQ